MITLILRFLKKKFRPEKCVNYIDDNTLKELVFSKYFIMTVLLIPFAMTVLNLFNIGFVNLLVSFNFFDFFKTYIINLSKTVLTIFGLYDTICFILIIIKIFISKKV